MNYLILAETEFFALINGTGNGNNMEAAYNGFVESLISLCYGNGNSADAAIAMAYAENELQHHHTLYEDSENSVNLFVRKALSFIRKMQKHAAADHIQVPPLSAIRTSTNNTTENPASPLQWTGNAIDIKRRKNESRTYFLDRMQEKLNRKILRDEELERMRR